MNCVANLRAPSGGEDECVSIGSSREDLAAALAKVLLGKTKVVAGGGEGEAPEKPEEAIEKDQMSSLEARMGAFELSEKNSFRTTESLPGLAAAMTKQTNPFVYFDLSPLQPILSHRWLRSFGLGLNSSVETAMRILFHRNPPYHSICLCAPDFAAKRAARVPVREYGTFFTRQAMHSLLYNYIVRRAAATLAIERHRNEGDEKPTYFLRDNYKSRTDHAFTTFFRCLADYDIVSKNIRQLPGKYGRTVFIWQKQYIAAFRVFTELPMVFAVLRKCADPEDYTYPWETCGVWFKTLDGECGCFEMTMEFVSEISQSCVSSLRVLVSSGTA